MLSRPVSTLGSLPAAFQNVFRGRVPCRRNNCASAYIFQSARVPQRFGGSQMFQMSFDIFLADCLPAMLGIRQDVVNGTPIRDVLPWDVVRKRPTSGRFHRAPQGVVSGKGPKPAHSGAVPAGNCGQEVWAWDATSRPVPGLFADPVHQGKDLRTSPGRQPDRTRRQAGRGQSGRGGTRSPDSSPEAGGGGHPANPQPAAG
jgi:hypothetical protein